MGEEVFGVPEKKRPGACAYFGVLIFFGWGWGKNVLFDFYSIVSVLALLHIRHATLLDVLLHLYTTLLVFETKRETFRRDPRQTKVKPLVLVRIL